LGLNDSTIYEIRALFISDHFDVSTVLQRPSQNHKHLSHLHQQAPWSPEECPDGLEESWWQRLLEMRDTRIQLELKGDAAWEVACKMAAALEGLERDEADSERRVEEVNLRQRQLSEAELRLEHDAMLMYPLKNGQVDLPEPATGTSGQDGILLLQGKRPLKLGESVVADNNGDRDPASTLHATGGACILHRHEVERVNEAIIERGSDKVY